MTAPTPPHASPDGEMIYGKCYASYVQSVSDKDGDPDPYPDVTLLSGTAKFEAVFDGVSARGALTLPAVPRSKGIVVSGDVFDIVNSNLVDKEGREGVWLLASVDNVPITWRITVTLMDTKNRTVLNSPYIVTEALWNKAPDGGLTVNLPDLIPNPGALTAIEGSALRAAQQALDEIKVLKGLIDTTKTDTDASAASALTHRNAAEGFKNTAGTSATTATTQAGLATTARTGAETARTGAQTAQTGAQTARTGAETAKAGADAVKAQIDVVHAHVEQDVGHANTHAIASGAASQTATTKAAEASASAGVATTKAAEASQARADALGYRNTAGGSAGTATAKAAEAVAAALAALTSRDETKVFRDQAEGFAGTLSQRVNFGAQEIAYTSDGKPYLIENPVVNVPLTVDTSAGTRVMLGNVMVHGDTGWRRITNSIVWPFATTNDVRIARHGNLVTIAMQFINAPAMVSVVVDGVFPVGFRPTTNTSWRGNRHGNGGEETHIGALASGTLLFNKSATGGSFIYLHQTFRTSDPWPTELPGTPTA